MEFTVSTGEAIDVVDVTGRVDAAIDDGLDAGTATVFVEHTTAAVVVQEAEPRLLADVEDALRAVVPEDAGYRHDEVDDNAAAHLRAALLGESVTVPVRRGGLALGTWQSVLLVDCDGPRTRRLRVTVTAS